MANYTIRTKVYEIRRSSRGSSDIYQIYFDKERALARAAELQEYYKGAKFKQNFRVYEHTTGDMLIYSE